MRIIAALLLALGLLLESLQGYAAIKGVNYKPERSSTYRFSSPDGLSLRQTRRAGLGVAAAGAYGIMGINIELNFTPRWSSLIGFGVSTEFQTFQFQARRYLGGESLLPYLGLGFAHWTNNGETEGGIQKTNPTYVAQQFMTEDERSRGEIAESLMYPAVGVQYLILNGPWTGVGVNLELDLLIELEAFAAVPTGSLGFSYYF